MNKLTNLIASITAAVIASVVVTHATDDMSPSEFFARDKANNFKAVNFYGDLNSSKSLVNKTDVMNKVATRATAEGVPVNFALRITKVESGFQCHVVGPKTKHGRAQGVMQILPSTAERMGHRGGDLANCDDGLKYGMAYLSLCYQLAGKDERNASSCYVGGEKMVDGPKGKYAKKYVNLVKYAAVPNFVYAMN